MSQNILFEMNECKDGKFSLGEILEVMHEQYSYSLYPNAVACVVQSLAIYM